ncbi:MAG: 3-hydroxyacyl-ACP dehydratase [Bacteroidota bacterium]|nr:3-hydroxyacyl-ACP dehydratase [Bacteroidota bacterium]
MLKNDFFKLTTPLSGGDGVYKTTIALDKTHDIFKGHFPGLPVVPGVCMMAIVKELLEEAVNRPLQLLHTANIKFLSLINPLQNDSVDVELKYITGENNTLVLDGSISWDKLTFFKITRAVYQ